MKTLTEVGYTEGVTTHADVRAGVNQAIDDSNANFTELANADSAETTARTAGDTALQEAIAAEKTDRTEHDANLLSALQQEQTTRAQADNDLTSNINAVSTKLTNAISDREAADTALQQNITNEADARRSADNDLTSNINAVSTKLTNAISDREAADTALQQNITNEADARRSADIANTNAISDEVAARKTGDNSISAGLEYATCSTDAATAAKVVTLANFALSTHCHLTIKMTYANTAASPTLNVNGTGAKAIYLDGAVASAANAWTAGDVLEGYFDGTNYQLKHVQAKELLFRDMWTSLRGNYNVATGYYEMNGLTDITYNQALSIFVAGPLCAAYADQRFFGASIVTNTKIGTQMSATTLNYSFAYNTNLRTALIQTHLSSINSAFIECTNLTEIRGIAVLYGVITSAFTHCYKLKTFSLSLTASSSGSIDISTSNVISHDSLMYLATNSANTNVITVTVHADVYAKLMGTGTENWTDVITYVTANNKKLSFASA